MKKWLWSYRSVSSIGRLIDRWRRPCCSSLQVGFLITKPWFCGTARICFQHFSPTQPWNLQFNIQGFGWPDDQGRDPVESWIHRHRGLAPPPSQASPQGGRHCPCHPCHLCLPHHHHHLNHHNHHCPIILILKYQHPILLHPFVHYNHNHNHIKILQI